MLLADACPRCGAAQRTWPSAHLEPVEPGTCTRPLGRTGKRCSVDLTEATTPAAGVAQLEVQTWIDTLIAELATSASEHAQTVFADLPIVVSWLLRHEFSDDEPAAIRRRGLPTIDAEVTAAVLDQAKTILGSDEQAAIITLTEILGRLESTRRVPPPAIPPQHWARLAGTFPNRYLRAVDAGLFPIERLRLKSVTTAAAVPGRTTEHRVRQLPLLLWPDWSARLLPVAGLNPELFRAVMSICLLIPGNADKDVQEIAEQFNPRVKRVHVSVMLQQFGAPTLVGQPLLPQFLAICCRLADHLDGEGSPIDYQRRRDTVPAETISWKQWQMLAPRLGTHPGDHPGKGRHLHVQRHLHQLLTGADLADPRHPLGFTGATDRSRYIDFTVALTPALRKGLGEHAETLLDGLGIDEPLLWSPPAACAEGLPWLGIDTDEVDMDVIRHILIEQNGAPGEAAEALGVNIDHVRLALERLDRPERQWFRHGPRALERQQLAEKLFTREFLEREYLAAGRTLADIGTATGFNKKVIAEYVRACGLPVAKAARQVTPIDEHWLRDQYLRRRRSTTEIAAEFGTSQMTVNRALERFGIPPRPSGVASHPHMVQVLDDRVPPDVKAAVEGGLHGWHRLNRFQIAMAFPSITTAEHCLGGHRSLALVTQFQRLEADIGAELFHRSAFGKPHRPTQRGQALLEALDQRHVRSLMNAALGADRIRMPGKAVIAAAQIRVRQRRNPGPPKPFDDIAVEPIRMTQTLRTLIEDTIDHDWAEFYGYEITERLGIQAGTIYPLLTRLHNAGWLSSRLEDEQQWLAGAPPSRGPGRRRTYFTFTADGRSAALRELETRRKQPSPSG